MLKVLLILVSFNTLAFVPSSFKMTYLQEFKSQVGKGQRKAVGTFDYRYPGSLKVDQQKPEKLLYVSNKNKTWIYREPFFDDEPAEVTVHTGQEKSLSGFFDILKAGLKSNGNYKVKAIKKGVNLEFHKAASSRLGIKTAKMKFKGAHKFKNLQFILINYNDGRSVSLTLSKMKVGVKFKKGHFTFKIPKGAKVINQ